MKGGTMFFVIRFPQPWPPKQEAEIYSKEQEEFNISLRATSEGALIFSVIKDGKVVVTSKTQPIMIMGGGMAIFNVTWKTDVIEIRINGHLLATYDRAGNTKITIETSEHEIIGPPSFFHQDAEKCCIEWMEWRKNRYANPKTTPKKNRRLKTLEEQTSELHSAIVSMADLVALIRQGSVHLTRYLAVELRALTYWDGKNYSPLLLRVAGRYNLPLPVYMLPWDTSPPAIIKEAQQRISTNAPSITKTIPNQVIVDIQEWLSSPLQTALIIREVNDTQVQQEDILTVKELILNTATVLGPAHYDEDLPDHLELLYQMNIFGSSAITNFLLQFSDIVINLGKYVLENAKMP